MINFYPRPTLVCYVMITKLYPAVLTIKEDEGELMSDMKDFYPPSITNQFNI